MLKNRVLWFITFIVKSSLSLCILMLMLGCSADKEQLSKQETKSNSVTSPNSQVLFDGRTFSGWEGNMDWFRIESGAIIAGTMERPIPNNQFLCTTKQYGDFELKLKARITGEDKQLLNAGVQFRSERIPDHHEVIGFQCDIGSSPSEKIWGYLYDESRRKRFLARPNQSDLLKVLKINHWNDITIRAEGPRIQIWINGFQTVDYVEEDQQVAADGLICLQIHSGGPAEAFYKDIELTELN